MPSAQAYYFATRRSDFVLNKSNYNVAILTACIFAVDMKHTLIINGIYNFFVAFVDRYMLYKLKCAV